MGLDGRVLLPSLLEAAGAADVCDGFEALQDSTFVTMTQRLNRDSSGHRIIDEAMTPFTELVD